MNGILEGEQPPDDTIRWLSHAGLTTRSIRDTAIVLEVLAEPGEDDRTRAWQIAFDGKRHLRIGIVDNFQADKEISSAFEKAVATIRGVGHTVSRASALFTDFGKGIATIEADRQAIGDLAFKAIDVLVLPTTPTVTPTVKEAAKNGQALSSQLTMFANYYGLPAVSVPCAFDSRGLPVGLQIVAKPWDDAAALQLAYEYEQATDIGTRHPIV
jgi:aspartyl-tRNA(Asn)/glutamyl-tRNA(Gln) amidotransferase subunit A